MGLKLFGPGGIDQKSNDLTRPPEKLRNALNIRYNINKEYEKRLGVDRDTSFDTNTFNDVWFIKSLNEYFYRDGGKYYAAKLNNAGEISEIKEIPVGAVDPTTDDESKISGCEYLNTFIFTHQSSQSGTFKYDGNSIYLAGLPVPTITTTQTINTASGFMVSFYDFIDGSGNEMFGPSLITPITKDTLSLAISTLKGSGFYDGYIICQDNTFELRSTGVLSDRQFAYSSISDDVQVGSKIVFRQSLSPNISIQDASGSIAQGPYNYIILEVEDISGGKITLTEQSFNGKKVGFLAISGLNVLGSMAIRTYFSSAGTTGYSSGYLYTIDQSGVSFTVSGTFDLTGTYLMSDVYDITTSKLRPPKCKFIKAYGWQIAYGDVLSFWDFSNKENNYTNNDLVMYSDISTGDLGENLSEINRQLIGDTYDGEITGLIRARDSLIVAKTNSIYALDGILVEGQYSVRKIETNEIGCSSDKSLMVIDGSVVFQGIDGLYVISGNNAKKISGPIDPFFAQAGFDPSKTVSVMDVLNESYLFFTNKGTVVFNFEFSEWFIWDHLPFENGVAINNNQEIRMFKDQLAYKFIPKTVGIYDFNPDYLSVLEEPFPEMHLPVNAWIKTGWLTIDEPSLLKKIVDVRFFSFKNLGQKLYSRLFYDWADKEDLFDVATQGDTISKVKPSADKDAFVIDFSNSSTKTILRKLDIQQAQSFSLMIGNNTLDEDMAISGYEINCAIIQTKDKNG